MKVAVDEVWTNKRNGREARVLYAGPAMRRQVMVDIVGYRYTAAIAATEVRRKPPTSSGTMKAPHTATVEISHEKFMAAFRRNTK